MMRRILAALLSAAIAVSSLAFAYPHGRTPIGSLGAASGGGGGGGATLVFNYASFSSGDCGSTINFYQSASGAGCVGSAILLNPSATAHTAGAAWYYTTQNIQSFTTDFTFQIPVAGGGITFCVCASSAPLQADANADGYGAYASQTGVQMNPSVAIMFDTSAMNGQAYIGTTPSLTGLAINGGNTVDNGVVASPAIDLNTLGINLGAGHVMSAHVVYDGTTLTMTLKDTSSGAITSLNWPINIPSVVGATTARIGFTGGTPPGTNSAQALLSWDWYAGYNAELSPPTFSPTPGSYTASQSVTLTCPSAATCYYTTNGKPPTTASSQYTGAITVSSSEYIQAKAVETNYTDSAIAGGNYSIATSGTPFVNFASGFASNGGLMQLSAYASLSSGNIVLTDTANAGETASACYAAPVNVQSFTWSTTIQQNGTANGISLVIKTPLPSSLDPTNGTTRESADGGPYDFGYSQPYLGYSPTSASIGVSLNLYSPASSTGLFENGAEPSTGTSTSPVALGTSGHSYTVLLTYSGTTLTEQINDTTASTQYGPVNYTVNIPAVIGSNTGYICIAGSTGGQSATQDVTAMTFHN